MMARGSPKLTYTKQSDGYLIRQRTRIEKKPGASEDWRFVSAMFLGTLCLAACLFFLSSGELNPFATAGGSHHHHPHHNKHFREQKHQVERFLRAARAQVVELEERIVEQVEELEERVVEQVHEMEERIVNLTTKDPTKEEEGKNIIPAEGEETVAATAASEPQEGASKPQEEGAPEEETTKEQQDAAGKADATTVSEQ
ncbi:expressed unknown protein [Seminavis robusta]|uniref:Uncharacterized protein n=1 Tax=Seminavis robusta TaxID=568900 RepID=A0A9N8ELS5_9STRA|nr:expressed unknown protein [Seminavis robusta]|eukprot:Sro1180_g249700.1 n/a (199) ;mRNA; f:6340-6936